MREFILTYWLEAIFGVIIAGLGMGYKHLFGKIKRSKAEQDAIKLGMVALLRNGLISAYNEYTARQYCPIYAQENVDEMYKQYSRLGGNGTVTQLVSELRQLPKQQH